MVVVGTAHVDVVATIRGTNDRRWDAQNDIFEFAAVKLEAGGTLPRVVRAASDWFSTVNGFALVGDDEIGDLVVDLLMRDPEQASTYTLLRSAGHETGSVVLVRNSMGQRILLGPEVGKAAKDYPDSSLIDAVHGHLPADYMFIDGYCLLHEHASRVYIELMRVARTSGTRVIFDLLPHDVDRAIDRSTFEATMMNTSILTANVSTAASMARLTDPGAESPDVAAAEEIANSLIRAHEIDAAIIRFGRFGIGQTLIARRGEPVIVREPRLSGAPHPGLGDQLLMGDLAVMEGRVGSDGT